RTGVDWEAAADRLARARVPQSEVDALRARVALLSRQLADDKDALEQRETELRRALKRLDRTVCPTVSGGGGCGSRLSSVRGGGGGGSNSSAAGEVQAHQPEKEREREEEDGAEAPEKAVKAVKAEQASPADVAEKADYVLLAERRLGEIEEKVRENAQLQSLVDELRLQMASVPDHIIAESALYRQAEASRNFYGAQAQRLQAEVERLFGEVASLRTSRGEFEAGVVAEAGAQRQALEAEMQRQHGDLVRVRHHRDQIQRELDERRAQDAVEDQKSTELKLLSDVRRERMNALISENKRLLAYVAVLRGDRAAFETYTDDELSKTAAVADELRAKLEQALRREASRADPSRAEADLASAREEVAALQARVRECEAALGAGDAAGELAAKQRSVEALALQRDGLQKTSAMLERELQAVCESFARLEAQNTSRVWDLGTKEAAVARVVAEKAKYEEKFIGLNKDLGAQRQANHALRQQSAKQLEHISAVEDRDRALSQQLAL
ncbi:E3 ubiquitin-protein ligase bre1, partial [Coemansia thaxteri]